jgi:hypothetical protein
MLIFYIFDIYLQNPSFYIKIFIKEKSPSTKGQRAGISKLPLLETFRTFKEDVGIENIRLNQLILQY